MQGPTIDAPGLFSHFGRVSLKNIKPLMAVLLVLALLALVAGAVEPRVPDIKSLFPSSVQDKEKAGE